MAQSAKPPPAWTPQHELALSGLTNTLKIPKKEAKSFLETLPSGDVADMMRQALSARTRSQAPPPAIPGAPSGAVPIHPTPRPAAAATTAPPPSPAAYEPPTTPLGRFGQQTRLGAARLVGRMFGAGRQQPQSAPLSRSPEEKADLATALAMQAQPPAAPIGPALAQTQPAPQATPPVKPRIRVPAAGRRIPPAPIAPTAEPEAPAQPKEKAAPLPLISNIQEYEQLAPGTEFIFRPDGHVYEKPANAK